MIEREIFMLLRSIEKLLEYFHNSFFYFTGIFSYAINIFNVYGYDNIFYLNIKDKLYVLAIVHDFT